MILLQRANIARLSMIAVLATLVVANLAMAFALVRQALAKKRVLVVPGVRVAREVELNEPSPEVVRDFALLYAAHFDNYTPANIEESSAYLRGWISPRFYSQATEALERRKTLVSQTRMASQILLPKRRETEVTHSDGEFRVVFTAVRRVYIADKLQSETRLSYTVAVEPGTPTVSNPYGLYITGQLIAPVAESKDAPHK